jgi:hypothetical protein
MERWAANTLRTLGIILTAGFVIVTSLILILLSMCARQNFGGAPNPDAGIPYIVAAIMVVIAGVWFITWLARGIHRSTRASEPGELLAQGATSADTLSASSSSIPMPVAPEPQIGATQPPALQDLQPAARVDQPEGSLPLHISPLGRKAIDRLVYALGAQIAISAIAWIVNQTRFWSARVPYGRQNWTLALLAPYVLYHIPYAILIYVLLKKPDRRTFAYSLAVPAVMILQAVFSLGVIGYYFVHQPQGFLLLTIPWLIHIVILVFAYQAIQKVGLHPEPSSIMVAALVTFAFFSLIHVITPFLYRFIWR